MHDNSKVRFDLPVQYGVLDNRDGIIDWVDCVVSEDGQFIYAGLNGTGLKHLINTFQLRNTPLVHHRDIDKWYEEEVKKLKGERNRLYKLGDERIAAVRFHYKSKTQLKKERQELTKPSDKKEYQIKI